MNKVPGLQAALKLYSSDKVKERAQGHDSIRGIFSSRENLNNFQETAAKQGGEGWSAFFQCLFQVVVTEKKAALKKGASTQADRRLAEAISLVRWMAERSVHLLSRKPFLSIFTHMTHLLVYGSHLFPPATLDYAKALKTLLSYPPHLANIDQTSWRLLMGICWSAVLGNEVSIDREWQEDDDVMDDETEENAQDGQARPRAMTQSINELANLLPILLSSSSAPLLVPLHEQDPRNPSRVPCYGYTILLKIHRFLHQHPTDTSAHLLILRSLNIVLSELELNKRADFVQGGMKVLPQLVRLWQTRNRMLREQLLITIRMLLPYLCHPTVLATDKEGVIHGSLSKLSDVLGKEISLRGGIRPLDMSVIRLQLDSQSGGPMQTRSFVPGFDFRHECAMTWAILDLYAAINFQLYDIVEAPTMSTLNGRLSKRIRLEHPVMALLRATLAGQPEARVLSLQVVLFMIDRLWQQLDGALQASVREVFAKILDEEDEPVLQSWAFIGIGCLAMFDETPSPINLQGPKASDPDLWGPAWQHATRKIILPNLSRAASHAALAMIRSGKVDRSTAADRLGSLLRNIEFQGPSYPYDAVCHLLSEALEIARADARLYSTRLEDHVLRWLQKWSALDGTRGKARMDPVLSTDLLRLLSSICCLSHHSISSCCSQIGLPDCAIIDRTREEASTDAMRNFILYTKVPDTGLEEISNSVESLKDEVSVERSGSVAVILTRELTMMNSDWVNDPSSASPPERLRRSVDLAVLALLFQGLMVSSGRHADDLMMSALEKLLKTIEPLLTAGNPSIPAQLLVWQGVVPLFGSPSSDPHLWRLLVRPGERAGIRQDILSSRYRSIRNTLDNNTPTGISSPLGTPSYRFSVSHEGRGESANAIIEPLWDLPAAASILRSIQQAAQSALEGSPELVLNATQIPMPALHDDEDFGEIRTADSDAMPVSREALECHLASRSLTAIIFHTQLAHPPGTRSSQGSQVATGRQLLERCLATEGPRFIQLGQVLCQAIQAGLFRITALAVEAVFDSLEEMISSYAFARDEGLFLLTIEFLIASMPLCVRRPPKDSELTDRAFNLMRFLLLKAKKDQLPSWRVRLSVLRLIDSYFRHDEGLDLWTEYVSSEADSDEEAVDPTEYVIGSLLDRDARVRFRAAVSAADLFSLVIPTDQHMSVYQSIIERLPALPDDWDGFLTDLLWKLNCCISSMELRAATIFHLYEIPASSSDFNQHLQNGLDAVSFQLGIHDSAALFVAHAVVVVKSQLASQQSPLRVPHRIYGFPSRKAFAIGCLKATTPAILCTFDDDEYGSGAKTLFNDLCKAAEIKAQDAVMHQFSTTSAMLYAAGRAQSVSGLPGLSTTADGLVATHRVSILGELFVLINFDEDRTIMRHPMQKRGLDMSLVDALFDALPVESSRAPPQTWHLSDILIAYDVLLPAGALTAPITLLALHRLFDLFHKAFLLSERNRFLTAIAVLISLHRSDLDNPVISKFLRREVRALRSQTDLKPVVDLLTTATELNEDKSLIQGDISMLATADDDVVHDEDAESHDLTGRTGTASLLEKLCGLLHSKENNIRRSAFDALRGMATLRQQLDLRDIRPETTALLKLLAPPPANQPGIRAVFTLDNLASDGPAWLTRAKEPLNWARDLALLMTSAIGELDFPYLHLQILVGEASFDPRRILPLLTKIFLSEGSQLPASTGKARAKVLSTHFDLVLRDPTSSTESKRVIVNIVVYLRHYHPPYDKDILGYNGWLFVDRSILASAASQCDAYVTSLMFLEAAKCDSPSRLSLSEQETRDLLYEIYSNVDDPDGFYGISDTDTWDALSRRLEHEGEYRRRFEIDVAALEAPKASFSEKDEVPSSILVAQDFLAMGLPHVASSLVASSAFIRGPSGAHEDSAIEIAWRVHDWSVPLVQHAAATPSGLLFSALRSVHREHNLNAAREFVEKVVATETARMAELGRERTVETQRVSNNLRCLQEIVTWVSSSTQDSLSMPRLPLTLVAQMTDLTGMTRFADIERLMSTRQSLIAAALQREGQHLIGDLSTDRKNNLLALQKACYLSTGKAARANGDAQAALNAIAAVRRIQKGEDMSDAVEEEYGEILWNRGEYRLALQLLQQRIESLNGGGKTTGRRRAVLLNKIAHWSSISRSRLPSDIDHIFQQAVREATEGGSSLDERARISHDYAVFADSQRTFIASLPEYREAQGSRSAQETSIAPSTSSSTSSRKKRESSSRQSRLTMTATEYITSLEDPVQLHENFVLTALAHYTTSLALSNTFDDSITAMISLWLQHSENAIVNTEFAGELSSVPSHKFIFLGPQLSARLDRPRQPTPFNDNLNSLVYRIAQEHPFHIVYQICTLASGSSAPKGLGSGKVPDQGAAGRAPKAAEILDSLAANKSFPLASKAAMQIKMLCESAVDWCLVPYTQGTKTSKLSAPSTCRLLQCRNLAIPPPSRLPPIDTTLKYDNVPTVVRYRSTYSLLGGVHRPKKMSVLDTTGQEHNEIFKGDDDVRQDSVMEQVFELSNRLLQRDAKTRERRLRFRTYRVIPLARKSGIMEFVGNSGGIGEWLKIAHGKYGRPGDIPADTFRATLKPIQEKDHNCSALRIKFDEMMKRFHPVMRHFFIERHKDPVRWFEMRLSYSRSVAVTSMVGHVLGVGDRHCSNVMIDGVTGELIQIDFGIVFGEGQKLRIPEKVPFRLTNDIVDGLGIHGVDGTFRQCSEHTLRVLRESSELIMTVLEVLRFDPLFNWTGDPEKFKRAQGGIQLLDPQSEPVQQKANQVLGDIRRKLRDDLSVESTVNDLIQQARDPEHLAKIFVGWQPWF